MIGKKIDEGGIWDHHFTQDTPGQQVDYMSLMAGDNGLCISWIIVENPDVEAATGVWTGDVGKYCSQPWYPGNQIAGTTPDGLDWRPACFWLDGDGSPGIPSASMKWSVNAFSPMGSNRTLQENRVCTSTIFSGKKELLEDGVFS